MEELDAVADELYGGDPADFVRVRTERADAARSAGERALATRIAALRKPTAAAAAMNRLARAEAADLAELAELGRRLREASAGLTAPQLRAASARRGELIESLLAALPAVDRAAAREVQTTLGVVLADPDTAATVLAGRLVTIPAPVADLTWLAAAIPGDAGPGQPDERPSAAVTQAEEEHRRRARARERARDRVRGAESTVSTLTERLRTAREELESAQQDLERAEREHRDAETELARARAALD